MVHLLALVLEAVAASDGFGIGACVSVVGLVVLVAFAASANFPMMVDTQMTEGLRYGTFDLIPCRFLCRFVHSENVVVFVWPPVPLRETVSSLARESVLEMLSLSGSHWKMYFEWIGFWVSD